MANEITIHVREQGTDQTQSALKGLQTVAVGVGAAVGIALAAAAVKAGDALTGLAKDSVAAASNMQESLSKSRVVFGAFSSDIESFAKGAASNLGQSNQAALETAGTFGNLFTSMGITREQSAGMSKSILQLGADLGSFNNIPVADALEKIRAGLVGESEPLRALGVNLNEAAIKAEALRLGLMKEGETLTASGKAQAAYSLILDQTKNAQGDFTRTSEGLANQQKKLAAVVEDLKGKLGTALLPVVTDITTKLGELIEKNGEQWAKNFASGVEVAAKAAAGLLETLRNIVNSSPFQFTVKMIQEAAGGDSGSWWAKAAVLPLNLASKAKENATGVLQQLPDGLQRILMGTEFANQSQSDTVLQKQLREYIAKITPGLGGNFDEGDAALPSNRWNTNWMAPETPGATSTPKAAGAGSKSPLETAWERINETLLDEMIMAGESRIEATRTEQERLLEETTTTATRMADILGVDLAKTLIPAFESIRDREKELSDQRKKASEEAIENAKKVLAAELEMSRQRVSLTEDLWRRFGGANMSVGAANNLALLAAAAVAGDTTQGGSQGAADAILRGGGNITVNVSGIVGDPVATGQAIAATLNAAAQGGPVLNSAAVGE